MPSSVISRIGGRADLMLKLKCSGILAIIGSYQNALVIDYFAYRNKRFCRGSMSVANHKIFVESADQPAHPALFIRRFLASVCYGFPKVFDGNAAHPLAHDHGVRRHYDRQLSRDWGRSSRHDWGLEKGFFDGVKVATGRLQQHRPSRLRWPAPAPRKAESCFTVFSVRAFSF